MSAQPPAPSIHTQGSQDQVILPGRIAFGICLRGIRARLGRSGVTLLGVSCGIAFLMSMVAGFHMKSAMRQDIEKARAVDRRLKDLTSELGLLQGKRLLVLAGAKMTQEDQELLARLRGPEKAALVDRPGPEAPVAAIGLGAWEAMATDALLSALRRKPLLFFATTPEALVTRLQAAGVEARFLGLDLRPEETAELARREREQKNRTILIVAISLLITVIGIANALLMSVTERFREIGTMKCLGALSSFVVKLFLIESSLLGLVGSLLGVLLGIFFPFCTYAYQYGAGALFTAVFLDGGQLLWLAIYALLCTLAGVVLSVVAGIYPARVASKMIPAVALSSNV